MAAFNAPIQIKKEQDSPLVTNVTNVSRVDESSLELPESRYQLILRAWIENGPLIREIKAKIAELLKEKEEKVSFEFLVPVDIMELLDSDASLGEMAIKETKKFIFTLQQAIFDIIKSNNWLNITQAGQIIISLRIKSLPVFMEYYSPSNIGTEERLIKISGTVVSLTPCLQYTKFAKYNCIQDDCPCFTGNDHTIVWNPGKSESSLVRPNYQCSCCCSNLKEDIASRKIGQKRILKFIINDGINCLQCCSNQYGRLHQAITVILRDELANDISFGSKYWITGLVLRDVSDNHCSTKERIGVVVEAFNVQQQQHFTVSKRLFNEEIPSSIRALYEDRAASPWSFVASIAYCFGASICTKGSYNRLKMALLLSLVLTGDEAFVEEVDGKIVIGKDLRSIHMFAHAGDVLIVQRLFSYASGFSDRCIINHPGLELFADINKHSDFNASFFVDGGSLLLAGKGVCIIPNTAALRKTEIEKLQKALESNKVTLNLTRRITEQSQLSQMVFPLTSTIWVASEITNGNEGGSTKTRSLVENFDLVYNFNGEFDVPEGIEEEMMEAIFQKAMGVKTEIEIPDEDLAMLIRYARGQRVKFSENAARILKSFFVASRRARSMGVNGAEVSQKSLQTLLSLAAAHAKLALRKEVIIEDALIAILIYEESITMRYGYSVVGVKPVLHFKQEDFAKHLGSQNDMMIRSFEKRVKAFCKTYLCGIDPGVYRREE